MENRTSVKRFIVKVEPLILSVIVGGNFTDEVAFKLGHDLRPF